MTPATSPAPVRPASVVPVGAGKVVGAAVMAVLSAAAVLGLHHAFVATTTGQLLDQATLVGGRIGQRYVRAVTGSSLEVVSVAGVVASVVLVVVIGVARRRPWRAALAALLVVGPSATTQLLKHVLLTRPQLITAPDGSLANSLPSGHTTFAAAVSAGVLVVLPPRARPLGALLAAGYTATTGVATIAAGWHRASDVVAAVAVVGAWLGAVGVALAWRARVAPRAEVDPRAVSGWRVVVPLLVAVAVVGAAAWAASLAVLVPQVAAGTAITARPGLALAYAGGAAAVCASSAAVFVTALLVLRPSRRRSRHAWRERAAPGAAGPAGTVAAAPR